MEEREKIIRLYDIYKKLLTEKQRICFESYYYEDLSLSEISENLEVSKSFIGKTLTIITNKLNTYEEALSMNKLIDNISKIKESTKDINTKKALEDIIK